MHDQLFVDCLDKRNASPWWDGELSLALTSIINQDSPFSTVWVTITQNCPKMQVWRNGHVGSCKAWWESPCKAFFYFWLSVLFNHTSFNQALSNATTKHCDAEKSIWVVNCVCDLLLPWSSMVELFETVLCVCLQSATMHDSKSVCALTKWWMISLKQSDDFFLIVVVTVFVSNHLFCQKRARINSSPLLSVCAITLTTF